MSDGSMQSIDALVFAMNTFVFTAQVTRKYFSGEAGERGDKGQSGPEGEKGLPGPRGYSFVLFFVPFPILVWPSGKV